MAKIFFLNRVYFFAFVAVLFASVSVEVSATLPLAPIRFLITFDDGPSGAAHHNPTEQVLDVLAKNTIQSGVKVIFFTQTRADDEGGTAIGWQLLLREYRDGHIVAFHTATAHHSNHRFLKPDEFELTLKNGVADLSEVSGIPPKLVRPPFWSYDARTLDGYHRHGLQMLLTDLSANDGKTKGVNWSWHKRSNLLKQLRLTHQAWAERRLPIVDGNTPIVVTFHDVNTYTARNVEVYLQILIDVAHELDMPLSAKPFYDDREQLERAALARTVNDGSVKQRLPGLWNWLWN